MDLNQIKTPCYVLEEDLLRNNLALIASVAKRADVEIILAFKAFALWKTFPIFQSHIKSTTASSVYEAQLALEEFGHRAHTYSPAYTVADFSIIKQCSSHITFNSLTQYERFYPLVDETVSCGIRINPEYSEVETELYNPCAVGTRFGLLADQLSRVLPLGIEGFHCHTLCESDSYMFERTLKHIEDKFGSWFSQLKWINFGGGHLMTREGYDIDHLIHVLRTFKSKYPHLHVIMEPGSAFAWQTGGLVASVVDIVENKGISTAILDISFTCHMPDCLEMPYQPEVSGAIKGREGAYTYRLGGNSCLSGDYMGDWSFKQALEIGDKIVFEDMMHYTTVKTNMFNGIHHPSIAIWTKDQEIKYLRVFDYLDYKNRMC